MGLSDQHTTYGTSSYANKDRREDPAAGTMCERDVGKVLLPSHRGL